MLMELMDIDVSSDGNKIIIEKDLSDEISKKIVRKTIFGKLTIKNCKYEKIETLKDYNRVKELYIDDKVSIKNLLMNKLVKLTSKIEYLPDNINCLNLKKLYIYLDTYNDSNKKKYIYDCRNLEEIIINHENNEYKLDLTKYEDVKKVVISSQKYIFSYPCIAHFTIISKYDKDEIQFSSDLFNDRFEKIKTEINRINKNDIVDNVYTVPNKYDEFIDSNIDNSEEFEYNHMIFSANTKKIELKGNYDKLDTLEFKNFPDISTNGKNNIRHLIFDTKNTKIDIEDGFKLEKIINNGVFIRISSSNDYERIITTINEYMYINNYKTLYNLSKYNDNNYIKIPEGYYSIRCIDDYIYENNSILDFSEYKDKRLNGYIKNHNKPVNFELVMPVNTKSTFMIFEGIMINRISFKDNKTNVLDDEMASIDFDESIIIQRYKKIGKYYILNSRKDNLSVVYVIYDHKIIKKIQGINFYNDDKLLSYIKNTVNYQTHEDVIIDKLLKEFDKNIDKYTKLKEVLNILKNNKYISYDDTRTKYLINRLNSKIKNNSKY